MQIKLYGQTELIKDASAEESKAGLVYRFNANNPQKKHVTVTCTGGCTMNLLGELRESLKSTDQGTSENACRALRYSQSFEVSFTREYSSQSQEKCEIVFVAENDHEAGLMHDVVDLMLLKGDGATCFALPMAMQLDPVMLGNYLGPVAADTKTDESVHKYL